jgi:hypothetical protein
MVDPHGDLVQPLISQPARRLVPPRATVSISPRADLAMPRSPRRRAAFRSTSHPLPVVAARVPSPIPCRSLLWPAASPSHVLLPLTATTSYTRRPPSLRCLTIYDNSSVLISSSDRAVAQRGGRLRLPVVRNGTMETQLDTGEGREGPDWELATAWRQRTARPCLPGSCSYRERSKDLISFGHLA